MTGLFVDVSATFSADGGDDFAVDTAFEVAEGETLVVLGPSGSGKTLLLETLAGFHEHEGTVESESARLSDHPPEDRGFGFVFQDYALFPHMTVTENVAFGTRYRESTRRPPDLLAEFGVGDLADRYPPTLSGGERQRVALARALAVDPDVLLLDESLSSLDVPTRQSLREDLLDALADVTSVYVTHDRTTARALADRIVVMNDGEIVQTGSPEAVFERPVSPLVARFTGSNCLPLDAVSRLGSGFAPIPDGRTHLAIRPEDVTFGGDLAATVERVTREDAAWRVTLSLDDTDATLDAYTDDPPAPGETVRVTLPASSVTFC